MNIVIDIDDTLTDSFGYLQPFVAEYFGVSAEALRQRGVSYSTLPPEWKARENAFGLAYYDRVIADTPFKPGAAEAVRRLKEQGHLIVIITGRTTAFYTDPYRTTEAELAKGAIPYDKLICTLDKGTACREEHIDCLIDDLPANCDAAAATGARTLLFTGPANESAVTPHRRVANWDEVVRVIDTFDEK